MPKFVEPKVYLIGYTTADMDGIKKYLYHTGQTDFLDSWNKAKEQGLSDGECMCSMFAKLCYASLVLGKNDNISRVRDIPDNIAGIINQSHLSTLEHCQVNFIIHNTSRVQTHEICRHRVGTAFSQTSGRYVRGDNIGFVHDPILGEIKNEIFDLLTIIEDKYNEFVKKLKLNEMRKPEEMALKKKLTSALRRILPNGQSNEIAISLNLRSLRHIIQMRTSRHSEWEIRNVFAQIYDIMKDKYKLMFADAKEEVIDQIIEVSGMKMNPYEKG